MATFSRPLHRVLTGLAVLALTAAVAACDPDDEQADARSVTLDADTPTDSEAPATEDPGNDRATPPVPPGEPLASAETMWNDNRVRLDVLSIARRGPDFVEVRIALTPLDTERGLAPLSRLGRGATSFDLSGVILEDVDAGERLLVLRDSEGGCVLHGSRDKPCS